MPATIGLLDALLTAFNAHDLDRIMAMFAEDCMLAMPRGPAPQGLVVRGKPAVRSALASRFEGIPNVSYDDAAHHVCGDIGVTQWTLNGTRRDGTRLSVRGCDFYVFAGDKVLSKDSYWKIIDG